MSDTFRTERPAQERKDIHVLPILWVMGALVVTVIAAAWISASFPTPSKPSVARESGDIRTATHYLTSKPQADIATYQQEKLRQLTTYGWTDATHSSAHVPVERAMQMLANQASTQEPPR